MIPERPEPAPADEDLRRLRTAYANNVDNRLQAAGIGGVAIAAMLSPILLRLVVLRFGVRAAGAPFVLAAVVAILRAEPGRARLLRAILAAPVALAFVAGWMAPLLWIPAILYAALSAVFFASLREPVPMVERVARIIQPAVPDFVAPYCRRVTMLWAAVFATNAVVLGAAAAIAPIYLWERVATVGIWTWMTVVSSGEFLVRKTYFRNYWYRGPFERFWSRLFPAEATPMGRRSAAYIREMRRNLGLDD